MLNKKQNLKEFEDKKLVLKSYPQKLFVEISKNCNLQCPMCENKKIKNHKKYNMNFDLFKKTADELFSHAKDIDLRGFGESIIHPEFEKFVDYALKFNSSFGLVTNFSIKNDTLWTKLVKNNFWLGISFDGATKNTFEKIRKGSKFETVIHNLELIKKIRDKYKKDPWMIYFIVTLQKDNINELKNIIKLADKFGIKRIELNPVQLPFFDFRKLSFHKKKTEYNLKKALKFAEEKSITILFQGDLGKKGTEEKHSKIQKMKRCKNPWTHLFISYDGKIGPCNHLMRKPVVLGDLNKRTFKEEWNNKAFQKFRKLNDTKSRYRACNWCYKNRFDHF